MTDEEYKILRAELCDLDVLFMRNEYKRRKITEKYETEKTILSEDDKKIWGRISEIQKKIEKWLENKLEKEE